MSILPLPPAPLASGRVEVLDLTARLSPDTPILQLQSPALPRRGYAAAKSSAG